MIVFITTVKFNNHVILTGTLTGIADFILTLRAKRLKQTYKIVVLHPTPIDDDTWETIGVFPDVYYVQGSAPQDLSRVNAAHSKSIVYLANRSTQIDRMCFSDALQVIATRVAESQYKNSYIITELGTC
jgi:hypothetical protein